MALSAPLNERQRQVLRWIADGCPDGVMEGNSHKTTAIALQGRRLVSISKKRGVWRASITPVGQHYLTNGTYPDGHWKNRTPPSRSTPPSERPGRDSRAPKPASGSGTPACDAPSPADAPSAPERRQETADDNGGNTAAPQPEPRSTDDTYTIAILIDRVLAAGGVLEVDDIDVVMRSRGSYADLTRESRSSPNLPPGKLLRARPTGGWSSRRGEVYFDDDFWAQTDVAPVPVPGRVSRFHPAVQAYRDDPDRHEVSRDSLGRACRILQAIAVEAESRGYSCTAPSRNSYNSGFRDTLKKGQLHVTIGDFTHRLRIRERSAPGGSPTYTVRRASTMPLWKIVRKKVFIPTGELLITIDDGDGLDGRPAEYRDGKRQALEDRLPSVLRELETRAREDDRRRREKAEEAARRRANWERAMHQARHDHREAYRRDVLRAQVVRWREDAELGLYVQELAAAVASITEDDERREAQAWLDWIRSYRENRNPLRRPAMPPDPQPSPAQLKPFLKGWSPYGPHTSY